MFQITGPAVVIVAILGYIGINTIVHAVGDLFEKHRDEFEDKK